MLFLEAYHKLVYPSKSNVKSFACGLNLRAASLGGGKRAHDFTGRMMLA